MDDESRIQSATTPNKDAESAKVNLSTSVILPSPNATNPKRRFVCPIEGCTKAYGKSSHIRSHLTWHSGEKPFVCDHPSCLKRFTRSDELARHYRTHTGEKPYECAQCAKRFTRSDHLTKHLRVHFKESKMDILPLLEVSMGESGDDDTDKQNTSSNPLPIPPVDLPIKQEMPVEVNENHYPFEKEQQPIQDIINEIKIEPERIVETSLPVFCPPATTAVRNDSPTLVNELPNPIVDVTKVKVEPSTKSSDRRFKCSEEGCGKAFKRQDELKRHARIHSGVRPFGCESCEKRFLRKDHLNKHIKTHRHSHFLVAS